MKSARWFPVCAGLIIYGMISPKLNAQSPEYATGPVTKQEVLASDPVFDIYVDRYEPKTEAIQYLQSLKDTVTLYVFWGSWCPATKKYIPGFIKTLEISNSKYIKTNYVGVDAQKKVPQEFLKKFQIKYIPTVVVLKGNTEVGRIEEKPNQPIEIDLIQILEEGIDN